MNKYKYRYKFSYQTIEQYNSMVKDHSFLVRCTPFNQGFQRVLDHNIQTLSGVTLNQDLDCFGNTIHYGIMVREHDLFVLSSSGQIAYNEYIIQDAKPNNYYLNPSPLTYASKEITNFNSKIKSQCVGFDLATVLSDAVTDYLDYKAGITDVYTSSSQCYALGKGVCQDYAHLLITLSRERGLKARYVVGYVAGWGETHAWVEVWSDGNWRGLDPTHGKVINDGYIKIAHGRDALDCSVIRGLRTGITDHKTQIRVIVEEI